MQRGEEFCYSISKASLGAMKQAQESKNNEKYTSINKN